MDSFLLEHEVPQKTWNNGISAASYVSLSAFKKKLNLHDLKDFEKINNLSIYDRDLLVFLLKLKTMCYWNFAHTKLNWSLCSAE